MSGFLERLALRALGHSDGLRPRPVSRFETGMAAPDDDRHIESEARSVDGTAPRTRPAIRAGAGSASRLDSEPVSKTGTEIDSEFDFRESTEPIVQEVEPPSTRAADRRESLSAPRATRTAATTPADVGEHRPDLASMPSHASARTDPSAEEGTVRLPRDRASSPASDPASGPAVEPAIGPATDAATDPATDPATDTGTEPRVAPRRARPRIVPPEDRPSESRPASAPRTPPRIPSRQMASKRGDHPADGPTIEVTIGRVEVRSSRPPPPAQRRRAEPRLSLESYLRQRREGRR